MSTSLDIRALNNNYLNEITFEANRDIDEIVVSTIPDRSVVTNPTLSTSSHYRASTIETTVRANDTASCALDNNNNNDRVVETTTCGFGPAWPNEFKIESLIPALLNRNSSVNVSLKLYVQHVQ